MNLQVRRYIARCRHRTPAARRIHAIRSRILSLKASSTPPKRDQPYTLNREPKPLKPRPKTQNPNELCQGLGVPDYLCDIENLGEQGVVAPRRNTGFWGFGVLGFWGFWVLGLDPYTYMMGWLREFRGRAESSGLVFSCLQEPPAEGRDAIPMRQRDCLKVPRRPH